MRRREDPRKKLSKQAKSNVLEDGNRNTTQEGAGVFFVASCPNVKRDDPEISRPPHGCEKRNKALRRAAIKA